MKKSRIRLINRGKVRETYELIDYENMLLLVASDRISTHNVVHNSLIPKKGEVLNALTIYWLTQVFPRIGLESDNHLIAHGPAIFEYILKDEFENPYDILGRAILVEKLKIVPIEFIFRSYLTGSLYDKFYSKGIENPYGVFLPEGLTKMSRFDELLFTPTEKSETDDPMNTAWVAGRHHPGYELARYAYMAIQKELNAVGIELIDSKLELGLNRAGEYVIADEVFTPDSSRFCELESIRLGEDPPWLDKQVARDEVSRIWAKTGDKKPVTFSPETVEALTQVYLDIFKRVTACHLPEVNSGRKLALGLICSPDDPAYPW